MRLLRKDDEFEFRKQPKKIQLKPGKMKCVTSLLSVEVGLGYSSKSSCFYLFQRRFCFSSCWRGSDEKLVISRLFEAINGYFLLLLLL